MKLKKLIFMSMVSMIAIALMGCEASNTATFERKSETSNKNHDKKIQMKQVPSDYYEAAKKQGSLEHFSYRTNGYDGKQEETSREAMVYLPYGYDKEDKETRYNILYLQHGAYGDDETWMLEYGDDFKNMIDHMIEDQLIKPLIIVMPYLSSGDDWYQDTTPYFYENEIKTDLMPAAESKYHTYAETTTEEGFEKSRSHRAFGGFSAGGTTTWTVFFHGLDRFKFFMPLSGGLTLGGNGNTDKSDAEKLSQAVQKSGYRKEDFEIFAATGTKDVAYQGLTAQINAMKDYSDSFEYTENDFSEGNLMYYTVKGNVHDYPYTYEYVYNGLQALDIN